METYIKINEDGSIIKAVDGYNNISDFSQNTDAMLTAGFFLISDRLTGINDELMKIDITYQNTLNTPVVYTNGFTYKPTYINGYALLIASGVSPMDIWDSSELSSVSMTTSELTELTLFLKSIAEPAFQTRKLSRKPLLEERAKLTVLMD